MKAKQKICPTCGELKYLWNKAIGCRDCVAKHKTSSETVKKLDNKPLKRSPLKKISDKRQKQRVAYSILRKQFLKDNPKCAVYPELDATEVHHRNHTEGERLNDTKYWLAVSRIGHNKIHNFPEWSYEQGFLIKG